MTTKKSSTGKSRKLNEFMKKAHAARKSGAKSFKYKGKTYERNELVYFKEGKRK
jgi:hypothetical protein